IFSIKLTMPPGYSATVSQETVSTHKGPGTTLPNFTIDQKLLIGKWALANIALIRRTAKINTSLICLLPYSYRHPSFRTHHLYRQRKHLDHIQIFFARFL